MFSIDDKTLANDKEYQFKVMHEQFDQRLKTKKYVFKFPCHDESIELEKPEDTYVECPTCHKHYLMTFSGNRTKLWAQ